MAAVTPLPQVVTIGCERSTPASLNTEYHIPRIAITIAIIATIRLIIKYIIQSSNEIVQLMKLQTLHSQCSNHFSGVDTRHVGKGLVPVDTYMLYRLSVLKKEERLHLPPNLRHQRKRLTPINNAIMKPGYLYTANKFYYFSFWKKNLVRLGSPAADMPSPAAVVLAIIQLPNRSESGLTMTPHMQHQESRATWMEACKMNLKYTLD